MCGPRFPKWQITTPKDATRRFPGVANGHKNGSDSGFFAYLGVGVWGGGRGRGRNPHAFQFFSPRGPSD